jgi:mycofactocin system FadH/OYE family oxidoreductase 2
MFVHLFNPLQIGKITLPNRICFQAHRTNFTQNGRLNDRHFAYYSRRAQGKCGMIILGEICIHPDDVPWETMIEAYNPNAVKDFRKFTGEIHKYETPVIAQLCHHGFQSSGSITRKAVWGPSANADISFGETSKPMEPEDFEVIINAFADAGRIAREGGFDGLEIDMGSESLLRQFLSPLTNHRQDEYGGSPENRMRFPLQVLKAVRKAAGDDFTIGIRLCADEKFWGAITLEDSPLFAETFVREGKADFINVTVGTYYSINLSMASMLMPAGFALEAAERIKKAVGVPVIASHHIAPLAAEEVIEKGQADAVGMIRNLICDPDMPLKMSGGKADDIRFCVRDNKGCIGRVNKSRTIACIHNPEAGNEKKYGRQTIVSSEKRVMVIGGGPAGLEAARTASDRGHDVTVYEKENETGGQINFIKKRPNRKFMEGVFLYLRRMLEKQQVRVITGKEADAEFIIKEKPDAVIVATGSVPVARPVKGNYGPPEVLNVTEALSGKYPVGEKILFIDENGGHHAISTVEFLAEQGKKIHMVTSDLFIGIDITSLGDLSIGRSRLLTKGVTFQTDVIIDEIQGKIVKGRDLYTNNPIIFNDYETIILDMGNVPNDALYKQLKGRVKELYRIGDCVAPRGIDMAILEARKTGEMI